MIIFFISTNHVIATPDLKFERIDFNKYGTVVATIKNSGESVDTAKIKLFARINVDIEKEKEIPIYWDVNTISNEGTFHTTSGTFISKGLYELTLRYEYNGSQYEVSGYDIAPGVDYDCKYFDINIDECYNKDGLFIMNFYGQGVRQAITIDPLKEVEYEIIGTEQQWPFGYPPKGTNIRYTGNDNYIFSFRPEKGIVNEIKIKVPKCSSNKDSVAYKKCQNIITTTSSISIITTSTTKQITTTITKPSTTSTSISNIPTTTAIIDDITNLDNISEIFTDTNEKKLSIWAISLPIIILIIIGSFLLLKKNYFK